MTTGSWLGQFGCRDVREVQLDPGIRMFHCKVPPVGQLPWYELFFTEGLSATKNYEFVVRVTSESVLAQPE